MAEIRWTEESAKWLQDIYEYISADNPEAAEKVISTIYEKAQVLIEHPEIGYTYQTVSGRKVRILLYGHYRITYPYTPRQWVEPSLVHFERWQLCLR